MKNQCKELIEPTLLAMWWLTVGGAGLWVVVGSVGYFVRSGWLPSEVSSWVQAIGSIAAILAAIFIASHDSRVRKTAEAEEKKNAIWRAHKVVADTLRRVDSACEAASRFKLDPTLWEFISNDLNQAQQHLKEVISSPGVDSKIYGELFEAMTSVEDVANALGILSRSDDHRPALLENARRAKDRITVSQEILKVWKDTAS
ncbi:hypothetical protein AB1288_07915 [Pseudomonas putida]|uniref:hypothetical protein n=1 Tax=Pseudomonas TaxID=286 RepID=UPI00345D10C7